jgi:hypothetical protein
MRIYGILGWWRDEGCWRMEKEFWRIGKMEYG